MNAHTNAHKKAESPEVERAQTRTRTRTNEDDLQLWQARYHKLLGKHEQLQKQVTDLQEANRQITAAALDKAKFEGAYNALLASSEQLEISAPNENEQPEQSGTLWWVWLTDRIKKR